MRRCHTCFWDKSHTQKDMQETMANFIYNSGFSFKLDTKTKLLIQYMAKQCLPFDNWFR